MGIETQNSITLLLPERESEEESQKSLTHKADGLIIKKRSLDHFATTSKTCLLNKEHSQKKW